MSTEKQKAKFGIIDVLILVLVLVLVAAVAYLVLWQRGVITGGKETHTVEYTVKITAVRDEHRRAIVPGATVYNSAEEDVILGTIVSVTAENTRTLDPQMDADGNPVVHTYDDVFDLYITVRSEDAKLTDEGFCNVAGTRILVGSEIYFSSGLFNRVGYCTAYNVK